MRKTVLTLCATFATLAAHADLPTNGSGSAISTISATNHFAYAANAGWVDARADESNGVVIGSFLCSGYLFGANFGWINLDGGNTNNVITPEGGMSTNDWGVYNLGDGRLRGFAYGANIGWVNFETNGAPRVNLLTGNLSGYVWSANLGWISLSNSFAYVQTDHIAPGIDSDADGIPDFWEYAHFSSLTPLSDKNDYDGDGYSDLEEYITDTNPTNGMDFLRITALSPPTGVNIRDLTWLSRPTRLYRVDQSNTNLLADTWADSGLGVVLPAAGSFTTHTVPDPATTQRYFRVKAMLPLSP